MSIITKTMSVVYSSSSNVKDLSDRRSKRREYYAKNKEKILEYQRIYRLQRANYLRSEKALPISSSVNNPNIKEIKAAYDIIYRVGKWRPPLTDPFNYIITHTLLNDKIIQTSYIWKGGKHSKN